MKFIAYL
ncbi:hypothetical protein MTR67_044673 [Solanum verrucosum]|nr:hypothetical protein MTR67_044673 [Solanum verrucosum]